MKSQEVQYTVDFKSEGELIGTLWVKVDFQYDEDIVEAIRTDAGYTQLSDNPEHLFSNHITELEYGSDLEYYEVNTWIDVEATNGLGIEIITQALRETNAQRFAEKRPLFEPPIFFEKESLCVCFKCFNNGRVTIAAHY
ncbi:hypothetical protein K7432_014861 [Basidiobolus ranarum]|uniref:Uncharacterized protein n=1 Tax=Basidiobolus ranarum TaxID=34480 RepID=A0ABR2WGV2_9FUNG